MNNSNETVGNRTRDLPVCSSVPQPTVIVAVMFWICFKYAYFCRQ